MNLKDLMIADLDIIIFNPNEHAESVLYNNNAILAIVEIGEDNAKGNTFGQQGTSDRAFFEVQESNSIKQPDGSVTTVILDPKLGDTITYENKTWNYAHIVNYSAGVYRIECTANESAM
ncbi:hypothetical protein [Pelosinus sp. UFO1]|uniref:hypothetical protein n=1 Tax=Pelosinus sp. UFO1 TaxID=484770 RepID=UPI0004D1B1AD|nr:hypothetical protein [Pelosinus sp. UFO1]AIF52006.1 hypothetical protein UFO1_2459 [Pelosinus sp. UFO1]